MVFGLDKLSQKYLHDKQIENLAYQTKRKVDNRLQRPHTQHHQHGDQVQRAWDFVRLKIKENAMVKLTLCTPHEI